MNIIMEISLGQIISVATVGLALITFFVNQKYRGENIEGALAQMTTLMERHDKRLVRLEEFRIEYETRYKVEHAK
jgi:hypothetical protein